MNPIDWLQDNIFYTDAKTKQINDAMRKSAGERSNAVRPSQADGEPTVYAQHAGTEYRQTSDGRNVYELNGVTYDFDSGQQVARPHGSDETGIHDGAFSLTSKNKYDSYKGTSIRNQDNQSIYEGTQVWKVPDHTGGDGGNGRGGGNRDRGRVIPGSGGKVQKGTDMGRSFNDLLATTNTSGYQPYGSSQLPTTQGNPFEGTAPKTGTFNPAAPGVTGATYDNYGADGGVAAASSTDKSQFTPTTGKEGRIEGGSDRKSGSRLDAALNDKAGINSYMSKFSSGDRERAANRAFLDGDGSMAGLRAKEAVNGVVYAGGKHYMSGESGDDAAIGIDRSQARDISNGKTNAQTLLKEHIAKNKDVAKETAAETQDPVVSARDSVKSAFADGAKTDFELNNSTSTPQSGVGPVVKPEIIENADLTGEKGKEYLRKLDAGEFF